MLPFCDSGSVDGQQDRHGGALAHLALDLYRPARLGGKAMHLGSRGVGGRRYQLVAVLLTYLAVSLSAVPIAIHQMRDFGLPDVTGPTRPVRGRIMLYAFKLLGRLTGHIPPV